jgi:transcriptional regulator with XRE-family HTH domain
VAQPPPDLLALGRAVRDFRSRLGISQEELGHRADLNRTYVGDIERGARNLSFRAIRQVAGGLDVQASELLARGEELEAG